jgi:hypothetical protein
MNRRFRYYHVFRMSLMFRYFPLNQMSQLSLMFRYYL